MPWKYVNPWNEPDGMVEAAFAATFSEEECNNLLSSGTDFDMGYAIAQAYNKCDELGLSLIAQSPDDPPYFTPQK